MGHKHSVLDKDTFFKIDPITRAITTDSDKLAVMQYDHNSERLTFTMPRYVESHDMSVCNKVEVHFMNIDAKTKDVVSGHRELDDFRVMDGDENTVIVSWLITKGSTKLGGKLNFLLNFRCVEDGVETYAWHTNFFTDFVVNAGMDAAALFENEYADVIEQWKASVMEHFKNDIEEWKVDTRKEITRDVSAVFDAELAVERARIDQFVALKEGSTTGDAELIDGRNDNGGLVWANIGNHVRNVGSLAEMIENSLVCKIEKVDVTIINGWVDTSGEYISNASSGDNHKCVQINVNPGERYLVYSEYGWSMPDAVAQKSDGGLVKIFNTSNQKAINDFDKVITIPDGAEKLTVNCMSYNAKPLTVAKIVGYECATTDDYIRNAISAMQGEEKVTSENLITSLKAAFGLRNGEEFVVESGDTQFSVGECHVEEGKRYVIKAGASYEGNPYIFFDETGVIIGDLLIAPSNGYQEYSVEVTAPRRASLLKVGQYGGRTPEVYEVTGYTSKKQWSGLKWVCVGDSLTEENERTTMHYHDYISEKTGISIVNMGVGGTGYKRREETNDAFYQRIKNVPLDADVITIFGGGNDLSLYDVAGKPTDNGTDTLCGCINKTIDELYALLPTTQFGIISPTPWINNEPSDNGSMSKYSVLLKEICALRGVPFLDLFHCSGLRPNDEDFRKVAYSKDEGNGVHPDETGHRIIAPKIKRFIESLVL